MRIPPLVGGPIAPLKRKNSERFCEEEKKKEGKTGLTDAATLPLIVLLLLTTSFANYIARVEIAN